MTEAAVWRSVLSQDMGHICGQPFFAADVLTCRFSRDTREGCNQKGTAWSAA